MLKNDWTGDFIDRSVSFYQQRWGSIQNIIKTACFDVFSKYDMEYPSEFSIFNSVGEICHFSARIDFINFGLGYRAGL